MRHGRRGNAPSCHPAERDRDVGHARRRHFYIRSDWRNPGKRHPDLGHGRLAGRRWSARHDVHTRAGGVKHDLGWERHEAGCGGGAVAAADVVQVPIDEPDRIAAVWDRQRVSSVGADFGAVLVGAVHVERVSVNARERAAVRSKRSAVDVSSQWQREVDAGDAARRCNRHRRTSVVALAGVGRIAPGDDVIHPGWKDKRVGSVGCGARATGQRVVGRIIGIDLHARQWASVWSRDGACDCVRRGRGWQADREGRERARLSADERAGQDVGPGRSCNVHPSALGLVVVVQAHVGWIVERRGVVAQADSRRPGERGRGGDFVVGGVRSKDEACRGRACLVLVNAGYAGRRHVAEGDRRVGAVVAASGRGSNGATVLGLGRLARIWDGDVDTAYVTTNSERGAGLEILREARAAWPIGVADDLSGL